MSTAHEAGTFPATGAPQASVGDHDGNGAPTTNKNATDCHFFLLGACRNGDACEFRHVDGARAAPPCGFWAQGQCFKGRECPFRHPSLSAAGGGYAAYAGRGAGYDKGPGGGYLPGGGYPSGAGYLPGGDRSHTPCTFFMRGHCAKGPACPFLHPVSAGVGLHMNASSGYPPEHAAPRPSHHSATHKSQPHEADHPYAPSQTPAQPGAPNPAFAATKAFGCSSAKAPPVPLETGGARDSPFSRSPFSRLESKGKAGLFGSAVGSVLKEQGGEVVFKRAVHDAGAGPSVGSRPAAQSHTKSAQKKRAAQQEVDGEQKAPLREAKKPRPNQVDPGMQLQSMFGRMAADPESRQKQRLRQQQQQQQQKQQLQTDKRSPKALPGNAKGNGSRVVMIGTAGKPKAPGTASVVGGGGGRPQKDATAAPKKVVAGVDPVSRVKPTEIVSHKEVDTAVVRKPQFGKAAAERARQLMSAKTHVAKTPPPAEKLSLNEAAAQRKHHQHKETMTTQAKAVSRPETFSGPKSFEDIMKEKRMRKESHGSGVGAFTNESDTKACVQKGDSKRSTPQGCALNTESHVAEVVILETDEGTRFSEESAGVEDAELDAELEEALNIEF
mmetsp:Transcript_7799/g.14744  ORF Transcript_7799/g.14744 Transcript_7799/m.14744 type:complete len:611 (-) Transcript_7799:136-1968(-)|eukprot:CAMPEP_0114240966 /NCGR_PEP_ID=MMETSP0058-20121206/9386_1 /TAXON_ID=36894 /ORGANISM="Pyramimonas parkeae, CCMP726" /LENGTH=610 /DNA_ID=CAMNT_0001353471 /DNA_START=406 /DNA_END=2238 /DNA_ORIENTATION=-